VGLPKGSAQPKTKQKPGQQPKDLEKKKDPKRAELTFDEMRDQGKELKEIHEGSVRKKLIKIRELRSKKKSKKKKNKDDLINLNDITTETEARKGGMPEHIAQLPEDHPIRTRWEHGFQERDDGSWKPSLTPTLSDNQKKLLLLAITTLLFVGIIIAGMWYDNKVSKTRDEIVSKIATKFKKSDPEAVKLIDEVYGTIWLPRLHKIKSDVSKIKPYTSILGESEHQYLDRIRRGY
jgi:hypothetical protein